MLILLMLILPNKGSLKMAMPPRTKPKRLLMLMTMPIHPSNPPLQPRKQKQQRMGSLKTVRMKPQP